MGKIFSIIRKVHLYALFVIASFLLMYFLSGTVMIMGKVFPRKNVKALTENVPVKNGQAEAETVAEICKKYNIQGEKTVKDIGEGKRSFGYYRPGYRAEILFIQGEANARVKITEGTFWSAMNDFHRLEGYSGSWMHQIWSFLYDLSCIALLAFALSGVYLWWKMEKNKRTGLIFIFASTGITIFTVWYLMAVC